MGLRRHLDDMDESLDNTDKFDSEAEEQQIKQLIRQQRATQNADESASNTDSTNSDKELLQEKRILETNLLHRRATQKE